MKSNATIAVVLVAFAGLIGTLVFMGACAWPPLFWDANLQITPAINRASGRGDTFAAYGTRILSDDFDDYRFNWHGQLYQAVLGTLLPGGDFVQLMRLVGWINAVSVVVCAAYYFCYLRFELKQGVQASSLWGLVGAGATAAVLLHWQGRAEQIVPAILCLGGLIQLAVRPDSDRLAAVRGGTAGVVAATSPLPAVLLLSAYALREVSDAGNAKWLRRLVMLGVTAAVVWAVLIWLLCPYSPWEILSNAAKEAGGGRPRGLRLIPAYWFWTVDYPLIGGIYLLFVASFIPRLFASHRIGFVRCAATLALAVNLFRWAWTAGLAYPPFFYSLICFFPVVLLHVIDWSHRSAAPHGTWFGRSAVATAAVLALAVSLGFVRHVALLPAYLAHGVSLTEARTRAQAYVDRLDNHSRIAYDSGRVPALVVLSDPGWKLLAVDFAEDEVNRLEKKLGIRLKYFFHSQDRDAAPPSQVGPFVLLKEHNIPGRPRILGWDLAPAMPGYQFSVYERPQTSP